MYNQVSEEKVKGFYEKAIQYNPNDSEALIEYA